MSKPLSGAFAAIVLTTLLSTAQAQDFNVVEPQPETAPVYDSRQVTLPSDSTITPEMWLYVQEMRRMDDPANAQRRRAEQVAGARRERILSRKWYGVSLSRPTVSPSPTMADYNKDRIDMWRYPIVDRHYSTATVPGYIGPKQF
ncbi:MAG: hypothetical protein WD045_10295 [Pirellulaceae bacterium]